MSNKILDSLSDLDSKLVELRGTPINPPPNPFLTLLPGLDEFEPFYNMFRLHRQPFTVTINDNILTITNVSKSIRISTAGIVELIAEKYQCSPMCDTSLPFPPDQTQIDTYIKSITELTRSTFNGILRQQDPRIEVLCQNFHKSHIVPLITRIQYYEWKSKVIEKYISQIVEKELEKKDSEVRKIQRDYAEKSEKVKIDSNQEITQWKRKAKELESQIGILNGVIEPLITEKDELKDSLSELYDKQKDEQKKKMELESELIKIKKEFSDAKQKLTRFESTSSEWNMSSTSTMDKPSFYNDEGTVISYPDQFSKYKLDRSDGEYLIYKHETDDSEFRVPKSLDFYYIKLIEKKEKEETKEESKPKKSEKNPFTPNEQKIINVLSSGDIIPKGELSSMSGVTMNHINTYIDNLIKMGVIDEIEELFEGKKIFKYQLKQ